MAAPLASQQPSQRPNAEARRGTGSDLRRLGSKHVASLGELRANGIVASAAERRATAHDVVDVERLASAIIEELGVAAELVGGELLQGHALAHAITHDATHHGVSLAERQALTHEIIREVRRGM